jgi:sarcosine oxidase subunit gamma
VRVVTAERLRPHSPLAGRQEALAAVSTSVGMREVPFLGQLNLRLDAGSRAAAAVADALGCVLPTRPCTAVHAPDVDVLWLGPDEWLVLIASNRTDAVAARLRDALDGEAAALTDVSAQRTTIALTGTGARELLAKGCSIDLHPRISPRGTCVQTQLAQTGIVIVVNNDTASDFLLLVRASFADYLASWLIDASVELGAR